MLGLELGAFASLLGVDGRTVRRWEAGKVRPSGSAAVVFAALREAVHRQPAIAERLIRASSVGGLSHLLITMLAPGPRALGDPVQAYLDANEAPIRVYSFIAQAQQERRFKACSQFFEKTKRWPTRVELELSELRT